MANEFRIKNGFFSEGSSNITGSLETSGSQVYLITDNFIINNANSSVDVIIVDNSGVQIYDTDSTMVLDSNTRRLFDKSDIISINFDNRQLYKSDGTTVIVDWENESFTGSLQGTASFAVTASFLAGAAPTITYIRRSDYTASLDPNVNLLYLGQAESGSAESALVWDITRLSISSSGATTPNSASGVAWTDRYIVTYS